MDRAIPSAIESEDFDAFYIRCHPILTSQVQLNFGIDYDTADQIITDALFDLKQKHDNNPEAVQLQQGSHFLHAIIVRRVADHLRRECGRHQQKLQFEALTSYMDKVDEHENTVQRVEDADFVQHIMRPLPKKTKTILTKRYVEELTLEDIGKEANVSPARLVAICQGTLEQLRRQHIEDYV